MPHLPFILQEDVLLAVVQVEESRRNHTGPLRLSLAPNRPTDGHVISVGHTQSHMAKLKVKRWGKKLQIMWQRVWIQGGVKN